MAKNGQVCLPFTDKFTAKNGIDWAKSASDSRTNSYSKLYLEFSTKSAFDSRTNSWPTQSSIHLRIHVQYILRFMSKCAKSIFVLRTNSQPIGCQDNLQFTYEWRIGCQVGLWFTDGLAINGLLKVSSKLWKSSLKIVKNCDLLLFLQFCTLVFSKWPLIWNQIVFFPCGSQFHLWNSSLCWRKEEFR